MDAILAHIQDNLTAYIIGAVFILPVLIAFRQYTGPVIFRTLEGCTYFAMFHLCVAGLTRFAWYFKSSSQFENNAAAEEAMTPFTTPVNLQFYQKELYSPQWIYWVEVAAILGVIYIVVVLRPVSISQKNKYKGKTNQAGARGRARSGQKRPARGSAAARRRSPARRR